MNYGDLIKDAFWITLRNRFLWFFGFFAGGTASNFNFNIPSGGFDDNDPGGPGRPGDPPFTAQVGQGEFGDFALIAGLVAVVLVIVLVFIVLSLISHGALAESVAAIDRGEGRRFSSAFRTGLSNFWRVLGYYVLFLLISLGLLLVIGIPVALAVFGILAATESPGPRILLIVLVALATIAALIFVFVPLAIVGQFALRELVVRREGVVGSIGGGYRLFRQNLGKSLLVWLINLAIAIGAGIALLIALLFVGLVLFLPTIVLAFAELSTAAILTGVIAGLILLPLLIVAAAVLGTFNHSYWTLAYLRLTAIGAAPQTQGAV